MEWLLPLIGIGSQFLGSFFGKTDTEKQNTNSVSNTTGAQNSTSSQDSTTITNGSQNTNSQSSQDTTQNSTGNQIGNVSRLDSTTQGLLTDKVRQLLASAGGGNAAVDQQLSALNQPGGQAFDADQFVTGIMAQATATAGQNFDSNMGKVKARTGAAADTNSAAALLENKLRNETAANLAGVRSSATATAADINRSQQESKTNQVTQLAGTQAGGLQALIGSLLNAGEQSTVNTNNNTTGQTSGTTNSQSTQQQTQQQNTDATQKTASTQVDTSKSSGQGSTNSQDWTKMFENIGKMFGATF